MLQYLCYTFLGGKFIARLTNKYKQLKFMINNQDSF